MIINRDLYLNRLISHKHNGLVKIVTGVRRCGKSYLLNTLFYNHLISSGVEAGHIIRIALDDYGNKKLLDADELYAYVKNQVVSQDPYYILLDEIQMVAGFEGVVSGFMHMDNVDVYVTGSNSKFLSSDIVTEFRGRGDEIRVFPLSFAEYYGAVGGTFQSAWLNYCSYGGMPLTLTMPTDEDKARYLTGLFEATYLADIIGRNRLKGNAEIGELTNILASSIGSLTNPTKLANTFLSEKKTKISVNTLNNYLDYLEDSFLIERALRYDIKGKRYINTPCKYYFVDIGLRNARLSFRQQEPSHIMENIIFNELKLRGYLVDVGTVETTENRQGKFTRKQLEVDFVVNRGNVRYYIQSALAMPTEEKLRQEEASLLAIGDGFKKIIVVNQPIMSGYNEQGIMVCSLEDFLLSPEKILN